MMSQIGSVSSIIGVSENVALADPCDVPAQKALVIDLCHRSMNSYLKTWGVGGREGRERIFCGYVLYMMQSDSKKLKEYKVVSNYPQTRQALGTGGT